MLHGKYQENGLSERYILCPDNCSLYSYNFLEFLLLQLRPDKNLEPEIYKHKRIPGDNHSTRNRLKEQFEVLDVLNS